jgi:hypothetical protein
VGSEALATASASENERRPTGAASSETDLREVSANGTTTDGSRE